MSRRGKRALFAMPATVHFLSAAICVAGLAASPTLGWTQPRAPYDPAVALQTLELPPGPRTFLSVDDGNVAAPGQVSFDVLVTYLTNPLIVYTLRDGELAKERAVVVESIAAGELTFAYGMGRRLQLGAALPVTFSMRGQGLSPDDATPLPGGLSISGLGDARLEAKYQLVHRHRFAIAGAAGLGVPSSFGNGDSEFLGDNFVSGRVRLGMHWSSPREGVIIGAHGGFIGRKTRELYAVRVGSQFTWAAGIAFRITDQFSLFGEGFGRTDLGLNYENSPVEAGGGLRLRMGTALTFSAGGSTGVYGGIGAPDLRVFASLGYAPDTGDRDGDGVANAVDKCVSLAEDFDGFKDGDGCPDPDNDGDLKLDGTDKCPTEAEDSDGYQDEDGCPDLDNDGDGIKDGDDQCVDEKEDGKVPHTKDGCPFDKRDTDSDMLPDYLDACPDQEEDMDGFEDGDGCPEPDNDKDGIDDGDDTCPLCPEDADGVNDGDGCPEVDNDGDGVVDAKDACDGEAETVNGIDDFDGCADEGGAELASFDGTRIIMVRLPEFTKTSLGRIGALVMDQVALIMVREQAVTKWTIAVSTRSKADAEKRGQALLDHLVARGVPATRLAVVAAAGADQVGIIAREITEPVEGVAPTYCPAELQVKPQTQPVAPVK